MKTNKEIWSKISKNEMAHAVHNSHRDQSIFPRRKKRDQSIFEVKHTRESRAVAFSTGRMVYEQGHAKVLIIEVSVFIEYPHMRALCHLPSNQSVLLLRRTNRYFASKFYNSSIVPRRHEEEYSQHILARLRGQSLWLRKRYFIVWRSGDDH